MACQAGPSKLTSPPRMAVMTVNGDCDPPSSQNGSVPLSSWYSSMPSAHCAAAAGSESVPRIKVQSLREPRLDVAICKLHCRLETGPAICRPRCLQSGHCSIEQCWMPAATMQLMVGWTATSSSVTAQCPISISYHTDCFFVAPANLQISKPTKLSMPHKEICQPPAHASTCRTSRRRQSFTIEGHIH